MPLFAAAICGFFCPRFLGAAPALLYDFLPSQGSPRLLVLLVQTPDQRPTLAPEEIRRRLFSQESDGLVSVAEYYAEASYGALKLQGEVTPWLMLPRTMSDYAGGNYGRNIWKYPNNLGGLLVDAVNAALAQGVALGPYVNGPGRHVDGLMIIHAGPDGASTHNPAQLWSRLDYHSMYGKGPMPVGEVTVDRFIVCPEYSSSPDSLSIHPYAHELGHLLGLADLYDPDKSSFGIGCLSLMSYPLPGNQARIGLSPDAFSRAQLGWLTPREISGSTLVSLPPFELAPAAIRLNTPVPGEYFLLSALFPIGLDTPLFGRGLLLWHANERTVYGNYFECRGRCALHPRLALVQADGRNDLEQKRRPADPADFFPGPELKITAVGADTGNPADPFAGANTLTFAGRPTGIRLQDIVLTGNTVQARIILGDTAVPGRDRPLLTIADQGWEEIKGNGNGLAEPGEAMRLKVTLENLGAQATNILIRASGAGVKWKRPEAKIARLGRGEKTEVNWEVKVLELGATGPTSPAAANRSPVLAEGGEAAAAPAPTPALPAVTGFSATWFTPELVVTIKAPALTTSLHPRLVLGAPPLFIVGDAPHDLVPFCEQAANLLKVPYRRRDVLTEGLPDPAQLAAIPVVLWLAGAQALDADRYPDPARLALWQEVIASGHVLVLSIAMSKEPTTPAVLDLFGIQTLTPAAGIRVARGNGIEPLSQGLVVRMAYPYYPNLTPHLSLQPASPARVLLWDLWGDPCAVVNFRAGTSQVSSVLLGFPFEALGPPYGAGLLAAILKMAAPSPQGG